MKRIILAASALSLVAAPAAFAQSATVNVNANVAKKCSSPAGLSSTINLGQLPLDADGFLDGNGDFVDIPGGDLATLTGGQTVWCNAPATVTVKGTALVHESLDLTNRGRNFADGFMRHIDLRVENFSYGPVNFGENGVNSGSSLDNATQSNSMSSAGAFAGTIGGQAQMWTGDYIYNGGAQRPLGGNYRAQFVLTVAPN